MPSLIRTSPSFTRDAIDGSQRGNNELWDTLAPVKSTLHQYMFRHGFTCGKSMGKEVKRRQSIHSILAAGFVFGIVCIRPLGDIQGNTINTGTNVLPDNPRFTRTAREIWTITERVEFLSHLRFRKQCERILASVCADSKIAFQVTELSETYPCILSLSDIPVVSKETFSLKKAILRCDTLCAGGVLRNDFGNLLSRYR